MNEHFDECDSFNLIVDPSTADRYCVDVRLPREDGVDDQKVERHVVRLQLVSFGYPVSTVAVGVVAVPGTKPTLVMTLAGAQREESRRLEADIWRRRDLRTREDVIRLIGSPRAKDRNKGRRTARKAGWL